jgi:Dynamin family
MSTSSRPADALTGFRQRRLDLADMLRAVLAIARAYHDERRQQEIRALLTRLAADRFQLAVVGQFSRGKTTLMNALLGRAYLPTGALPVTSVVTTVHYGARSRALVRGRATDLALEVPLTELARYVTQAGADRGRMRVTSAEVELPAELLRLGFEFVDTPGVGSAIAANTAATLQYLPHADAVIFVTGFDSALTEAEADFLIRATSQAGKLFLVINKRDLVTDSAAAEVTEYVRSWADQRLGQDAPQVFGMSALRALEAAADAGADQMADTGLPQFRSALIDFLTTGQGTASLHAVGKAAASLVRRQQRDLSTVRVAGPDLATTLTDFDARMTDLQVQITATGEAIASQIAAALPALLAGLRQQWESNLHELLAPAPAVGAGMPRTSPEVTGAGLTEEGREPAAAWLSQTAGEVRSALIATAASGIGSLLELARSPRPIGAAIAGLPAVADDRGGWSGADLPDLLLPTVPWVVHESPQPTRLPRRRQPTTDPDVARADALAAAVAGFTDRASTMFQDAAAKWAVRLRDEACRHAQGEAAQVRRYLEMPPRNGDQAILDSLVTRLATYLQSVQAAANVDDGQNDPSDPGGWPETGPSADSPQPCVICGEQESAVTAFLTHYQLVLASSEDEQSRHAARGGFCPLHTWQYASLGSPVGIAAGNARLAEVTAAALQVTRAGDRAKREMPQAVARLLDTGVCPACTVLTDTQRQAAARLSATTAPDVPVALCLRHLALLLQAGPPPDTAEAAVGQLATMLQRTAEDMRSYVLKREALRRSLVTADEADAYRRALRMLAGLPSLAQPSEPDPDRGSFRRLHRL